MSFSFVSTVISHLVFTAHVVETVAKIAASMYTCWASAMEMNGSVNGYLSSDILERLHRDIWTPSSRHLNKQRYIRKCVYTLQGDQHTYTVYLSVHTQFTFNNVAVILLYIYTVYIYISLHIWTYSTAWILWTIFLYFSTTTTLNHFLCVFLDLV